MATQHDLLTHQIHDTLQRNEFVASPFQSKFGAGSTWCRAGLRAYVEMYHKPATPPEIWVCVPGGPFAIGVPAKPERSVLLRLVDTINHVTQATQPAKGRRARR